jgi:hypothetical protein
MLGIPQQVTGREDGPFRNLLGDVECRDHCHLKVAALHGGRLSALFEQGTVQVDFHIELARSGLLQFLFEHRKHLGMPIGFYSGRRDAELDWISGLGCG